MGLNPGARLGPYELVSPLGAGGMGEVYKAKDTRLDRTVAVKVLPSHLSSSPDVRQRFEREARTVSQLSHPHICALYDIGREGETDFLVMEYLEGETLAARLSRGLLPVEQTLKFGIEMAGALDRAHRQGIVHRDLKPGNVMLTKTGVKLLDFGLAKALAPAAPAGSLTALPTVAGAQNLTEAGTILGTFQYMSPEQLEGKEADARSDIFALGAVLYEMASGEKAFSGSSQASLISAILRDDPRPLSQLQPMTPPALDRVVKTCLAKDPEERWQSAHDIESELKWIAQGSSQAGVPAPVARRRHSRERLAWILAGGFLLAALALASVVLRRTPVPAEPVRFTIAPPPEAEFELGMAVSPDGRKIAFVAGPPARYQLWVRSLETLEAHALPGTEGARFPFWSPDGRSLGFFAQGKLQRIDVAGGSIVALANISDSRGGSWGSGDVILFSPSPSSPLRRVNAAGGAEQDATELDTASGVSSHRWPCFLPDGRHFVFLERTGMVEKSAIVAGSLDSKAKKILVPRVRTNVAFAQPGYLLYVRDRALVAHPFDPVRLSFKADPVVLESDLDPIGENGPTGYARFAVVGGTLCVRTGVSTTAQPTWFDRSGAELGKTGPAADLDEPSLSPDGGRVALDRADHQSHNNSIWILDLGRGTLSRLTFGPGSDASAVWSPDGARVAYGSNRGGPDNIYAKMASGASGEELVFKSDEPKFVDDWSRDGKNLIFESVSSKTGTDLWVVSMLGEHKAVPYLQTPFEETHSQFSPDGKFVAYTSNESGRDEVYVQTFPVSGGKWQISTEGGDQAQWRRDGKELFFLGLDRRLRSVDLKTDHGFEAGIPKVLFTFRTGPPSISASRCFYAVSPDGQRFLVNNVVDEGARIPITVVVNWAAVARSAVR
jgi:Tol biopolymer transport system component